MLDAGVRSQVIYVERLFEEFDADKSGALDVHEVGKMMETLGTPLSAEQLARAMRAMDGDGDGTVDLDELKRWWFWRRRVDHSPAAKTAERERVRALFKASADPAPPHPASRAARGSHTATCARVLRGEAAP